MCFFDVFFVTSAHNGLTNLMKMLRCIMYEVDYRGLPDVWQAAAETRFALMFI